MVSESGLDLQRRDRSGPPRNLAPSDFFHVPAKPRQYRNSVPYLAAHGKCSRSPRLNRPKSSLGDLGFQSRTNKRGSRRALPRVRKSISVSSLPPLVPEAKDAIVSLFSLKISLFSARR